MRHGIHISSTNVLNLTSLHSNAWLLFFPSHQGLDYSQTCENSEKEERGGSIQDIK